MATEGSRSRWFRISTLAALVALTYAFSILGTSPAKPTNVGWLSKGDAAQHMVGWAFYSSEPLSRPVSKIHRWLAPAGTTIGLVDSIPGVAIPLKFLLGARGSRVQYFGIWILCCVLLLAVISALFLRAQGCCEVVAVGGGVLTCSSPVLWDRAMRGHFSLCAMFLLVFVLLCWALASRESAQERKSRWLAAASVAVLVSAAVHPYLALLSGLLLTAMVLDLMFKGRWRRKAAGGLVLVAVAAGAWRIVAWAGFFDGSSTMSLGGFGAYSFDLGSLVNPADRSRLLPAVFDALDGREGYAYLGAGALALALVALTCRTRSRFLGAPADRASSRTGPVPFPRMFVVASVLALLGMLPNISLFGFAVVTMGDDWLPESTLIGAFRALGRLAWPLHFCCLLWIARSVSSIGRNAASRLLMLSLAVLLQRLETKVPSAWSSGEVDVPWARELEETASRMMPTTARLALVPAYLSDGFGVLCGHQHPPDAWVAPALAAARLGWSFNSGSAARMDRTTVDATCGASALELAVKQSDEDVVLVFRERPRKKKAAGRLEALSDGELWECELVGEMWSLCVHGQRKDRGHREAEIFAAPG